MTTELDPNKIKLAICLGLWGFLGSLLGQPLIHGNQDAINLIVTVFSILSGFLIAVITLIGDPKSLPPGSWRIARLGSSLTYNRLIRQKWLFKSYLVTLFLIFVAIILKDKYPPITRGLEYAFMYFATISCILSFRLPGALIELQQERIEHEINERRMAEGIED